MEDNTENKNNDMMDMTSIKVIEITVNNGKEIYMIKSSEKTLIEKNKLIRKDLLSYLETSSTSSQPNYIDKKILLYNPEIGDNELYTFMRNPDKYSFLDVLNLKQLGWTEKSSKIRNDRLIEVVGPKLSFLKEELTLYVIT